MPAKNYYEYTIKLHRWQQLSSHDLFAFLVWHWGILCRSCHRSLLHCYGRDDNPYMAVHSIPVLHAEKRGTTLWIKHREATTMNNTTNAPEQLSCIRFVRLWESLAPLQPFLEFFDGRRWVTSGIITGTCSPAFVGRYRVNKPNTQLAD